MGAVPQSHPGKHTLWVDMDRTSPTLEMLQEHGVSKQLALSRPWVD